MASGKKPRILCVDDEPNVLAGLQLNLGRRFEMTTAGGGSQGLELIRQGVPFAVVVSDMRMPEMNGAEFLARVRSQAPHTVRILLTGQTDLDSAIAAVNEGQIFRFLSKPCAPDQLLRAVDAAVEQYRLVTAERELLEQTLMGSLATLGDILALANPEAFGRATRIRGYVTELAAVLEIQDRWQVEAAAMVSQIGCITLDADTMRKVSRGQMLSAEEERKVAGIPQATEQLLAHIPRLEGVRAILSGVHKAVPRTGSTPHGQNAAAVGARLLEVALDFDRLDGRGLPLDAALETMRERVGTYDPVILERFAELRGREGGRQGVNEIPLSKVRVGMVFADDVKMKSGVLLAPRGYVVTEAFVERVRNSQSGTVIEPVRCMHPAEQKAATPTGVGP